MNENTCLICSKNRPYPICQTCKKDPFSVEEARQKLAEWKDAISLQKMYSESLPEIEDKNTNTFWDEKLNEVVLLKDQDGLTQDRTKIAFSYIPQGKVKVLDVGAGYGFLEELLEKERRIKTYGIDISPEGVRYLAKRFKGEFKTGVVHKIPYPDNYFDAVLALELLEHIPPSRVFAAYAEMRRVLKDGGTLIVSVPLNEGLRYKPDNPSGHVREYLPTLIKEELKLADFAVKRSKLSYAFPNYYAVKKLIQKILWFKWKPNDIVVEAIKC